MRGVAAPICGGAPRELNEVLVDGGGLFWANAGGEAGFDAAGFWVLDEQDEKFGSRGRRRHR